MLKNKIIVKKIRNIVILLYRYKFWAKKRTHYHKKKSDTYFQVSDLYVWLNPID